MSRIQTIQSNCGQIRDFKKTKNINISKAQSFGGDYFNKEATKIIVGGVEAKLEKGFVRRNFNNLLQFFNDTSGEFQNQIINSVFTTTLAPIFIAYNPLSSQDKKTRHYTAWRQPLSAAIALAGSLPVTYYTNKYWNNLHNQGYSKSIDLRMSPSKEYYAKDFKEKYKNGGLDFLKKNEPADLSEALTNKNTYFESSVPKMTYKSACFKEYVRKEQENRQNIFAQLIGADPNEITSNKGIISVSGKIINEGDPIPNMDEAQLKEYLKNHNLHNRKMRDFLKEKFGFEFFEEKDGAAAGQFKPFKIEKNLSDVKAMAFLRQMGLIDNKMTETDLLKAILSHRQIKNSAELAKTLGCSKGEAEKMYSLVGKDTSRNIQMAIGEVQGKAENLTLGQFFHQLGYKSNDGTLLGLMDKDMASVLDKFKNDFIGAKLEGFTKETNIETFTKRIINIASKEIGSMAKNDTKYAGIAFNFFITAGTCTILNWVYPRFMEKFRPELCDNKKGGN